MQPCQRPTLMYGTQKLEKKNIFNKSALNEFELEQFCENEKLPHAHSNNSRSMCGHTAPERSLGPVVQN